MSRFQEEVWLCTVLRIFNIQRVMKLTDFSLNEAKKRGRNRCYIFDEKDYSRFIRKGEITQELREATRNGFQGFVAFYQPVIEAKSGRLSGAESLMRFSSSKFGMSISSRIYSNFGGDRPDHSGRTLDDERSNGKM